MTKILVPFSEAVALHVYPAMAREGLRRKGKRYWWERREDGSWVVLEVQMSKWTTRTELGFTVNTHVWPPGTWEHQKTAHEVYAQAESPAEFHGPIYLRPGSLSPELWPWRDFREIDMSADFGRVAGELRDFLLFALTWAREHSTVDGALRTRDLPFGLSEHWAEVMRRAAGRHD